MINSDWSSTPPSASWFHPLGKRPNACFALSRQGLRTASGPIHCGSLHTSQALFLHFTAPTDYVVPGTPLKTIRCLGRAYGGRGRIRPLKCGRFAHTSPPTAWLAGLRPAAGRCLETRHPAIRRRIPPGSAMFASAHFRPTQGSGRQRLRGAPFSPPSGQLCSPWGLRG